MTWSPSKPGNLGDDERSRSRRWKALPAEVRDPLVRICSHIVLAGSAVLIAIATARSPLSFVTETWLSAVVCTSLLALFAMTVIRRVPLIWRGAMVAVHMSILTCAGLVYHGFGPGVSIWLTFLVLFVGMLAGGRAMLVTFAGAVGIVMLVAAGWRSGVLPLDAPFVPGIQPFSASTWLRHGLSAAIGCGACAAIVYLLQQWLLDYAYQQRSIVEILAQEQQKRAEVELHHLQAENRAQSVERQGAERLRAVFRAAPIAIGLLRDRIIVDVNDKLLELFGYTRDDMIDRGTRMLYETDEDHARAGHDMYSALQRDGVWEAEVRFRRKDGTPLECLTRMAPLDAQDLSAGVVTMLLDIAERKRTENLQLAKARAEAANRAKSAFLANMSHEIRTPMNAILGFCQLMLRERDLTPAQRQHLHIIDRNGEHLLALINDVLEMSKIEAHRIVLRLGPFDLPGMFQDLRAMFADRAKGKGLDFEIQLAPGLPQVVNGDEGRLRQIFVNLLANAVKFTDHGRVHLHVRSQADKTGGWRLHAEIEDTGPGIAPEDLPRLFRQFEQAAAGMAAGGGTGLGLAISRELAHLMGGEITVESTRGAGSTFSVNVPVGPVEVPLLASGEGDAREVVRLAADQPPCRVLVVDDVEDNRRLLAEILQGAGFETHEAADGAQAVEAFDAWNPHGILMDVRMPVMDGDEATMRIRSRNTGRKVKIISLSASVFSENREQMLGAGADDFLGKPFHADRLFEKLGRLLALRYVYAPSGPGEPSSPAAPTAISPLPVHLVTALRQTLDTADLDRALELIDIVATHDQALATELRSRTEAFDYDGALSVLARAPTASDSA